LNNILPVRLPIIIFIQVERNRTDGTIEKY
jgi:hypothetical protein